MTKILILNVGWSNKGSCALVNSTMEAIKRFSPQVEFNLLGPEPERANYYGFQVKKQLYCWPSIKYPQHTIISLAYLIKCIYINIFNSFNLHIPVKRNSRLFDYYDCDLVIHSGGDQMSGENGIWVLEDYIHLSYAILLGKPVVLYGESLGYFKSSILNSITKFILNRTRLILVREGLSKEYLDSIGITKPNVYVTADPAYFLNVATQSRIFEILSEEGIYDIRRPLIGINPSGLINRFILGTSQKSKEKFTDIMARVIDKLVQNLNATIIMIPHVYSANCDDGTAIDNIFHKVENKYNVKIIKKEYAPEELKGIIGQCDLFIGARMHATIASTSMLVPTVGIAYSHKMHGIIGKMLGQEKYIIDINEVDYESLISKINDAWENREIIKRKLEIKIPEIRNKAILNGKFVKDLIDSLEKS